MADITPYLIASGNLVLVGQTGRIHDASEKDGGILEIARAPIRGIDSHLWMAIKTAVDELKLHVILSSIDTGTHAVNSRHYTGRAADSNRIGSANGMVMVASSRNDHAVRLVQWLLAHGFHIGEGKPWAAILFGPVQSHFNPTDIDHSTHLHLSLPRKRFK